MGSRYLKSVGMVNWARAVLVLLPLISWGNPQDRRFQRFILSDLFRRRVFPWTYVTCPPGEIFFLDGTCQRLEHSFAPCPGEQLRWTDGQCHLLLSSCSTDGSHWLVLGNLTHHEDTLDCHNNVDCHQEATLDCQPTKCQLPQVWWPETCSCVSREENPCKNGELLVNPFGEGICSIEFKNRRFSRSPEVKNRFSRSPVLDLIPTNEEPVVIRVTRRNCHVDENGKCRNIINVRKLRTHKFFQQEHFIDWLRHFKLRTLYDENE